MPGFVPTDPRVRALEAELRRITVVHEAKVRQIGRQRVIMLLLLAVATLLALSGCAPFWSNVMENWQGPCQDRCSRACR